MAGVALLQPQDVLKRDRVNCHHHRLNYVQPMRSRRNSSSAPVPPNPNPKNNRRKRSPQKSNGSAAAAASLSMSPPAKARHPVMGEVKILKRGEALTDKEAVVKGNEKRAVEEFVLSTTDRLGPEPDMVPKQIRIGEFYAGSGYVTSPEPNSLPMPAFSKKTSCADDATSNLRRLLKLNL